MPPFKPPSLLVVPEDKAAAPAGPYGSESEDLKGLRDSLEYTPDGHISMLGKSLRGDYVFSSEGDLIKASGQSSGFYKVCDKDIMMIKPLGAGACATVHKGYHMQMRKFVAVKRVNSTNKEMRQQMLRDIKILSDAQNIPGLLSFLGAYVVPGRDQMAVVLEYMDGGTLADVLKKLGRIPEDVLAVITGKLLQGLAFMHAKHMVHRDIKPANILMAMNGEAKLSDFGISAQVDHTNALCMTYAGTMTYMSPERLENKPYNFAADIWSLGLVLLECLTGQYPFNASGGPMELIIHVLQDDVTLPPPGSVSDLCRDFLALCLQRDPARRPAATALLTHPWVAQAAATDVKGLMRRTMFDAEDRLDEVAFHFSFTYYSMLGGAQGVNGLSQLAGLYLDHSLLSHQGAKFQGCAAILAKLQEVVRQQQQCQQQGQQQQHPHSSSGGSNSSSALSGQPASWQLTHVDRQPLLETGCVVIHVMGNVALQSATAFTESFILAKTPGGEYYIANQVFRLM